MDDDGFDPHEWHVGDPADWGDGMAGVPDIPYMGYLNDDDDADYSAGRSNTKIYKANALADEAWRLKKQGRYEEALVLINQAIENFFYDLKFHNRKAMILQDMGRYEEALDVYDFALSISDDKIIRFNKASCMYDLLDRKRYRGRITRADLDMVNEALKVLPEDENNYALLQLKGDFLEKLGEPVKAKICYLLSNKLYDEVSRAEVQLDVLKYVDETYIAVAGTKFYHGFKLFREGVVMDLIREPENEHDPDAIRVEIEGKTVGYVANSPGTLINEVKSATDIKNSESTQAKFVFVLLGEWIIARLI